MHDGVVRRARRYYLLLSQAAREIDLCAIASLNLGQQLSEPGVLLPDDFTGRAAFNAEHYFTAEDANSVYSELEALGYNQPWTIAFDATLLLLRPLTLSKLGSGTTAVVDLGTFASTKTLSVKLDVELVAGSAPALAVELQTSSDLETWDAVASFSVSSTDGKQSLDVLTPRYVRAVWTISGADSAFTFSLTGKAR